MNNDMDAYLRTSLKNWAARQQLPDHGQERLLRLARAEFPCDEIELTASFLGPRQVFQRKQQITKEWVEKPFGVSRRWSLGIAATWRFVA